MVPDPTCSCLSFFDKDRKNVANLHRLRQWEPYTAANAAVIQLVIMREEAEESGECLQCSSCCAV